MSPKLGGRPAPWNHSSVDLDRIKAFESTLLFHGTIEPIAGPLRPGGYDDVLWTAESSAVAQSYIPVSGGSFVFSLRPWEVRDNEVLRPPTSGYFEVVEEKGNRRTTLVRDDLMTAMGFQAEVEHEGSQVRGWRWLDLDGNELPYEQWPRTADLVAFLDGLGYKPKRGGGDPLYEVRTQGSRIIRSDEKVVGTLFIIHGKEGLRILDASTGEPGSLVDPEYHHIGLFRQAEAAGYDGIKIDDLLQSKHWGNFGHQSVGLFRRALDKVTYDAVPATNYDPEEIQGWRTPTPEFVEYAERVFGG